MNWRSSFVVKRPKKESWCWMRQPHIFYNLLIHKSISLEAPEKAKNRYATQSSSSTPRDTQKNVSQLTTKAPAHPC
jgi:hypothetical protein